MTVGLVCYVGALLGIVVCCGGRMWVGRKKLVMVGVLVMSVSLVRRRLVRLCVGAGLRFLLCRGLGGNKVADGAIYV